MLFIVLGIVYSFIIFISLFGDYQSKEIEKDYKKYAKITHQNSKDDKLLNLIIKILQKPFS